jgi:DNA-directed RNA polymerase I, II, and III subunit RPABC2
LIFFLFIFHQKIMEDLEMHDLVPFHCVHGPLPLDTNLLPPRKTRPETTRFEISRIRSERSLQLSKGAPATVPIENDTDVLAIALREIKAGTVPIVIRREITKTKYEDWCFKEQLLTPKQPVIYHVVVSTAAVQHV